MGSRYKTLPHSTLSNEFIYKHYKTWHIKTVKFLLPFDILLSVAESFSLKLYPRIFFNHFVFFISSCFSLFHYLFFVTSIASSILPYGVIYYPYISTYYIQSVTSSPLHPIHLFLFITSLLFSALHLFRSSPLDITVLGLKWTVIH